MLPLVKEGAKRQSLRYIRGFLGKADDFCMNQNNVCYLDLIFEFLQSHSLLSVWPWNKTTVLHFDVHMLKTLNSS